MTNNQNVRPTNAQAFSSRVQGFKSGEDVTAALNATFAALDSLSAKLNGAEAEIKAIQESNLPDSLKQKYIAENADTVKPYDQARVVVLETLNGVVNGIRAQLKPSEIESVAKMDHQQLRETAALASDLFKTFGKLFPSKVVSQ